MDRRNFLKYATLAGSSFTLSSCISTRKSTSQVEVSPTVSPVAASEPLKVGFVYTRSIGDFGWTYSHDLGRREMEAYLQDKVKTTFLENVNTDIEAERVIRQLALDGNKLIFATSLSYTNPMMKVAPEFPDVVFEHCTGYRRAVNVGTYLVRFEEARYLTGMIAGKMTKSQIIGFVASEPIAEVIRGINAFTQGLRQTNPQAKVRVLWARSWYDPAKEREIAQALINLGADVLTQHTDSSAPVQLAQEKRIYAFGYNHDLSKFAPTAHLTSVMSKWGKFYTDTALAVINNTWKSRATWDGIGKGMVDISPMNQIIPTDVQQLVNTKRQEFIQGVAHPFSGPVKDQQGVVRVPKGKMLGDAEQLVMNWYVEGVEGAIPQKSL
ncbi:BMP family ABC transporter substrate-binding protein [Fortiea contorta]|uniref:BMP family ABC transporter substrate-binding protein n=1 Tax=Fortiea contorta TaxID=1892405 RepID=UPI00034912B6|nr:BMP family ABC transporter substrate-binding protein [Fortiea contorta]